MAILTIVKKIKEVHPYNIVLVKSGKFVHVYGKDSYIISYLLKYKLKTYEKIYTCGFSDLTLNKVIAVLENKKINYIIVNKRYNYEVEEHFNLKKLNKYNEIYNKARNYINLKFRLDNAYLKLFNELENKNVRKKILKIEGIIDDD